MVGVAIATMILLALVTGSVGYVWVILVLGPQIRRDLRPADRRRRRSPVLISLLNSFTGLAVAASGFVLDNYLLIVAGTLVGASSIILTRLLELGHGPRSLPNILFSAFGSVITATGGEEGDASRPVRAGTPEDVGVLLAYARKVVIIPGYGLAVAQAQHTARELEEALKARGVDTFFAIHPVAGRMPGHMNVLLAEANVPYDDLKEMDEANPAMASADVAQVVEANDTGQPGGVIDARQPHLRHCRSSTPTRPRTSSSSSVRCDQALRASRTNSSTTRRRRCCSATPRTRTLQKLVARRQRRAESAAGVAAGPVTAVHIGDGRDRMTRPLGPTKISTSFALPDIVHFLECTRP